MTTSLLLHPVLPFVVAARSPRRRRDGPAAAVSLPRPPSRSRMLLPRCCRTRRHVARRARPRLGAAARRRPRPRLRLAFIVYSFIAGIYAWEEHRAGPKVASSGCAGAGVGVVLAGDLLSLFFFWEWLTVASLFLIWFGNTPGAWAAGFRYLVFHLLGATVMLMGILLQHGRGRRRSR
jgi:hypothetical protein